MSDIRKSFDKENQSIEMQPFQLSEETNALRFGDLLKEKDEIIQRLESKAREQEETINIVEKNIHDLENELSAAKEYIVLFDQNEAHLEHLIQERITMIEEHKAEDSRKLAEIQHLREAHSQLESQISDLNKATQMKQERIECLENDVALEVSKYDTVIATYTDSNSDGPNLNKEEYDAMQMELNTSAFEALELGKDLAVYYVVS